MGSIDLLAADGVLQNAQAKAEKRAENRCEAGLEAGEEPLIFADEDRARQKEVGLFKGVVAGAAVVPGPRCGDQQDLLGAAHDLGREISISAELAVVLIDLADGLDEEDA